MTVFLSLAFVNFTFANDSNEVYKTYKSTEYQFKELYKAKKYIEALASANQLLEMDPSDPVAYLMFALTVEKIGKTACIKYDCLEARNYVSEKDNVERDIKTLSSLILDATLAKEKSP